MERNKLVWVGLGLGSTMGGLVPSLWDSSIVSMGAVIGSAIGGFIGIWIAWKLGE